MHCCDMRRGFDKLLGLGAMNIRVNELQELTVGFEERLLEAKEKCLRLV